MRAVEHVDLEGDEREPGAGSRAEGGEEEAAQAALASEKCELGPGHMRAAAHRLSNGNTRTGTQTRGFPDVSATAPEPELGGRERADLTERSREKRVVVRRPDGYANRARRAEPVGGAHDHALAKQLLEEGPRIVCDLREEEVPEGRPG